MGRKSSPPPQPDPSIGLAAQANMRLAESQERIANEQLALQREQMADARRQYEDQQKQIAEATEIYKTSIGKQNEMTDLVMDQARKAQEDYETLYRPNEQRLVNEAQAAGSAGLQEEAAGRAGVDVQRQIDMQRDASGRAMASMGVNPNSGRFQAMDRADSIRAAAARAGAQTGARMQEEMRGQQLRASVANFGRGIAGAASGGAGQAAGMTMGTNQTAAGGFNMNAANNAAMMGAYGQGMGGLGAAGGSLGAAGGLNSSAASILSNQYQNQLQAWNARQQARGGLAGAIGGIAGMAMGGGFGGALGKRLFG